MRTDRTDNLTPSAPEATQPHGLGLDALYLAASSLAAKTCFQPSHTTVAEHIQLKLMRRELRDVYGVRAP